MMKAWWRVVGSNLVVVITCMLPYHSVFGESGSEEIRQQMIRESIASYPGNCPCPYNLARNGSRCGKRSAWSRRGGYSPLCYPTDISDSMVKDYKKSHGIK
jgi:hypothetical protein